MARIPVGLTVSLVLLGAVGCDESTTLVLERNPAVRIIIDPSRCPLITKCSSCLLGTDAFDKNSRPTEFPTLRWSSSNHAIATVEELPNGEARINGWTVGSATISVEVVETNATDDVSVTVESSLVNCTPPATRQTPLARR